MTLFLLLITLVESLIESKEFDSSFTEELKESTIILIPFYFVTILVDIAIVCFLIYGKF